MSVYRVYRHAALLLAIFPLAVASCECGGERITLPPLKTTAQKDAGEVFSCTDARSAACINQTLYSCERVGEFLQVNRLDCGEQGLVCALEKGCTRCVPHSTGCNGDRVMRCRPDGDDYDLVETCEVEAGYECHSGACRTMCEIARIERSYVGCEFFAVDLDNAAIDELHDASHQQYAVVVSNLQNVPVDVSVEVNQAPFGSPVETAEVAKVTVPPGDLEVFKLSSRNVDGATPEGLNDGTHTAVTSNAYRIRSTLPIIAYQFNPLDNVNVFSNDASLLLPSSAIGYDYTVVGWPQTIGHSDDPMYDFDSTSDNEDLRAFLTIVGTVKDTHLKVTMGTQVVKVVGADPIPEMLAGDAFEIDIGPFDVVNLETQGFMADFTGSTIEASEPISVFVGSEASDSPVFERYETRQCCADHLEEQLFPNNTLGGHFVIARMPFRTKALNEALVNPEDSVAEVNEPEWVRVVASDEGITEIITTLPAPANRFGLEQYQDVILTADQDFEMTADKPVAVLQTLASQEVVGIPKYFPGGDPSIIAVPPVEQYRDNYVFLTPDKYVFDFVTITAPVDAQVLLDGNAVSQQCVSSPISGTIRGAGVTKTEWQAIRCSFSSPIITGPPNPQISYRDRREGVHTIESDQPVGIVVYGFDRFVSYAYTGGLNLEVLY